jgi:hypothetical protein
MYECMCVYVYMHVYIYEYINIYICVYILIFRLIRTEGWNDMLDRKYEKESTYADTMTRVLGKDGAQVDI